MSEEAIRLFDDYIRIDEINLPVLGRIESIDNDRRAEITVLNREAPADYPLLVNVPVLNYRAGEYEINLPVSSGDRVVIFFTQTDISGTLQTGEKNNITDDRFSLTNAVAIPLNFVAENESYTPSNDLEIKRGSTVIKIAENGDIIIEADNIRLGENATERVRLADGSASTKVFAE